jgi:uncharacterized protein (TIGR03435 family)
MSTRRTVAAFLISTGAAIAQVAETDSKPQFEVASIKLGSLGLPGGRILYQPGGKLRVTNISLKQLIQQAYDVDPFQVSGGPAWVDSTRYDINATSDKPSKPPEIRVMLQSLLSDRFQLTIHRETRELPVYALVLAKKDGKLGPKLTESKEGGCTVYDPANPPRVTADGICGTTKFNPSHGWLTITRLPLDALTKTLREVLGRAVIDKTGLTGNFDIHLEWAPDEWAPDESEVARLLAVLPPGVPNPPPSDGPSIFVAVQEQLGLKLESQKGPVEVLVIDRAEKPSEN